jgi:hypothetical protein
MKNPKKEEENKNFSHQFSPEGELKGGISKPGGTDFMAPTPDALPAPTE